MTLVGVLELSSKYRYGITKHGAPMYLFRPYNEAEPEFIVGSSHTDTSHDQIAVVASDITPTGSTRPRGRLVRLLGPVGDTDAERAGLLEHYCPAIHRSKDPLPPLDESLDGHRQELSAATGWCTFHIDPPGCRDIDDALAYHPATNNWAITIADASAAVPVGSHTDTVAAAIGSTFYNVRGEVLRPMLPPAISEGVASLLPGQRRRGVTWFVTDQSWALTWITVEHSMTYESFADSALAHLCGVADEEPHAFVERMMIAYNHAAARTLVSRAPTHGIIRAQSAADAAEVACWTAIDPVLGRLATEAATYCMAAELRGHAGLGLDVYCHASSPLRRYVDLVNQRLLKALITDSPLPITPSHTETPSIQNERMRANRRFSRDLLFLELAPPGRIHTLDVIWVDRERVWLCDQKRLIRIRHEVVAPPAGTRDRINIFCDPTKHNWRRRILTSPVSVIGESSTISVIGEPSTIIVMSAAATVSVH